MKSNKILFWFVAELISRRSIRGLDCSKSALFMVVLRIRPSHCRDFTEHIQTHLWFWCRRVDLGEPLEFFLTAICDSLFDKVLIAQDCTYSSTGILADSFSKSCSRDELGVCLIRSLCLLNI